MKKFKLVTILLVMFLFVSSCLVGFAKEKVITYAKSEDLLRADPYDNNNSANIIIDYLYYDRLVDLNPETGTDFVPALATEWYSSPDGKEYTFKLRKGVKFHNGEPFNAECVKVSLERFLNEKLLRGFLYEGLKGVEVVDDYTVIVKFNEANVLCLLNLTLTPMLPAKAFKEKGIALFDNPIGTGAFIWDHWKRGTEIVLNKNPDYWGKPAYIDKFVYLYLTESSTRMAGVLTGEIDITDQMSPEQISLAESSSPNVEALRVFAWDQVYLGLKTDRPPFTDIKFRQAIDLAIDKENIVNKITRGGRVSTGYIPKGIFGFDDKLVPVKRDVEKAKQLVKESIYDGRTLNMIIPTTGGGVPKYKEVLLAIQGELKEVGINVSLEILEGAVWVEKRVAGDYDILYNQDSHLGDLDWWLWSVIHGDRNHQDNIKEELKTLVEDQRKELDKEKRIGILRKIENIMNTDFGPQIWIFQFEQLYLQRKGIIGGRYYGSLCPDFRYAHYEE